MVSNTADGAMNTLDFEVVGVFQSFSKDYDARAVKSRLRRRRSCSNTRGANVIVVSLRANRAIPQPSPPRPCARSGGRADWRSSTWTELNDFYERRLQLYDRQFGVLQLIILVMVLLSVVNSVNMSLFERSASSARCGPWATAVGRSSRSS